MNALLIHPAFPPTFWSYKYAIPFIRKKAALPRLTDARPARGCGCADAPLKGALPKQPDLVYHGHADHVQLGRWDAPACLRRFLEAATCMRLLLLRN